MSVATDVIDTHIQGRLRELNDEIDALQKARAALLGEHLPTQRKPRAGKRSPRRGTTRLDQTLGLIVERPGITSRQIGEFLGLHPTQPYRLVRQLEAQGKIRRTGRGRGWVSATARGEAL